MSTNETPRYAVSTGSNVATAQEIASGLEAIKSYGEADDSLYIQDENGYFQEEFMIRELFTHEDFKRFVKSVEKIIRTSNEYGQFVSYVYAHSGADSCSILSNIDMSLDGMGLELHHCPLTLFDICEIVINYRFSKNQAVTSLLIADEIMEAHSKNMIGVVPLSVTAHKLVHAGILKVHSSQVIGSWVNFVREYADGITPDHMTKLINFTKITPEEALESFKRLDVDMTKIQNLQQVSDFDKIERLQNILTLPTHSIISETEGS